MLNLKRLRSLIVVAEEGNLSRAATRLHLSQPALSRRIRELEKDLRFSLFERVGRGIRLTGEGRGFLAQCRDLLAHADAVEERAKAFASGEGGVLRAGASPQMLECLFPDLLVRYRARYPLVEVELVEGTSGDLETRIERGEIDFAVIAPARADRFDHRVLPSLVVLAAVARTHRLDGTTPIELRDIMDEPFLLLHHGYRSRQAFDAACRLANVAPRVVLESGAPHNALLALAEAGLGIAIIPSAAGTAGYDLHVAPLFYSGKPLDIQGMICWRHGRYLAPYAEQFIAELLAVAKTKLGRHAANPPTGG